MMLKGFMAAGFVIATAAAGSGRPAIDGRHLAIAGQPVPRRR